MAVINIRGFFTGGSLLTSLTVLGVVIGIGLGFGLREVKEEWTDREVMYLKLPGDIFLRTLGALILPLIVSSLVSAIGSLDLSLSKKIGIRALLYYLSTTAGAAILGVVLAVSIRPGFQASTGDGDTTVENCKAASGSTVDTLLDLLRNVFPPNLVGATIQTTRTYVLNVTNDNGETEEKIDVQLIAGTNLMGLVVFSMVLGVTLGQMKQSGKAVLDFFTSLGDATMIITSKVVWTSPVAICFLIASQLVDVKDIGKVFQTIGWYFGTVIGGLLIHGLILLPLLFFFITRTLPFKFMRNMFQSLATAFGTASSSATLPITLKCLEEGNNVDKRVSRFVIPIGATVNMNGTALYLPVGAIYIAQLCGQTLGIGQLISVSLISIATSIGAAGIPQIGMVIMITVLDSIGLPASLISFIMPIDWLLERFRTAVNVLGDSFGAGIVAHISREDLAKIPMPDTFEPNADENENEKELKSVWIDA